MNGSYIGGLAVAAFFFGLAAAIHNIEGTGNPRITKYLFIAAGLHALPLFVWLWMGAIAGGS